MLQSIGGHKETATTQQLKTTISEVRNPEVAHHRMKVLAASVSQKTAVTWLVGLQSSDPLTGAKGSISKMALHMDGLGISTPQFFPDGPLYETTWYPQDMAASCTRGDLKRQE